MQSKEQTREQMFSMIADWQHSGRSQKKYCIEHNIAYHVFHYWYKRYRNQQSPCTASFIPVNIETLNAGSLELYLPDGKRIVFHQPVSSDYLKTLIA